MKSVTLPQNEAPPTILSTPNLWSSLPVLQSLRVDQSSLFTALCHHIDERLVTTVVAP